MISPVLKSERSVDDKETIYSGKLILSKEEGKTNTTM